jgi:hypothetical protein
MGRASSRAGSLPQLIVVGREFGVYPVSPHPSPLPEGEGADRELLEQCADLQERR